MQLMNFLPSSSRTFFTSPALTLSKAPVLRRSAPHKVAFQLNMSQISQVSVERRSGNYKQSIWQHDFVKTLKNDYTGEMYVKRAESLKHQVKRWLDSLQDEKNPLPLLVLIDDIQRLGLGYIFDKEIRRALAFLFDRNIRMDDSLHAMSLYFRLLRQHRFSICQDVFKVFQDPQGKFVEHITQDVLGILSLYEASYCSIPGEDILDEAKVFTRRHLEDIKTSVDPNLAELVNHTLERPLHLRGTRLEARWFIDAFSKRKNVNSQLLELAKLDYNMVQEAHQKDVVDMLRWWDNLDLLKRLPFARNRLVESFCWALESAYEPEYKSVRESITKLGNVIIIIDDVYDVYATFDEAKLLTDAIERWDVNAIEELPDYLKLCFLVIFNTSNEFGYHALKEHELNIIAIIKKLWLDQCNAYTRELKWFHTGYKPTLEEYLDNGWVSIGMSLILIHAYFLMCPEVTKEAFEYLEGYPDLIRFACMIIRLNDDLGTSKGELERGDVPKSIQCYMHHEGVSEEAARKYIRQLTDEMWKKVNAELLQNTPLPEAFKKVVVGIARFAETVYQHGEDGFGFPEKESKDRVLSLLVDNIAILESKVLPVGK